MKRLLLVKDTNPLIGLLPNVLRHFELIYNNIKRIHAIRYPYNNFLY